MPYSPTLRSKGSPSRLERRRGGVASLRQGRSAASRPRGRRQAPPCSGCDAEREGQNGDAREPGVRAEKPGTETCGFPGNVAQETWLNADRMLPLGWMLELWRGAILATPLAGWQYRES